MAQAGRVLVRSLYVFPSSSSVYLEYRIYMIQGYNKVFSLVCLSSLQPTTQHGFGQVNLISWSSL